MKLYKFRPLADCNDLERIEYIINSGFYCCDFLNFNDMNEGVFSANQSNISLDQKQQYKICSFSGKNALNSQLMWGHYANAGMGIVIEVEANNCKNIKEVIYSDKYSELNSIEIEEILTHKTIEWKYENEFRCIIKDDSACGITRKIGNITKIYFGTPYKQLGNYGKIKEQHKKLKKYLDLKKKLKDIIKIDCKDFKFT